MHADIPDKNIYFKTWIQYFHFTEKGDKPNTFFKNPIYEKQLSYLTNMKKMPDDEVGKYYTLLFLIFNYNIQLDTTNIIL